MHRITAGLLVGVVLVATAGCSGSTRHIAVGVDYAFARAVFAFDDAEFVACQANTLTAEQCARLNPMIRDALVSVKAATLALKALPKDGQIPLALPDLLQSLTHLGQVVDALSGLGNPQISALAEKLHTAIDEALAVIRAFSGFVPATR